MKKIFCVLTLFLLPVTLSAFTVNAGDEYPPKATGTIESDTIEEGSFASILKSKRGKTIEFVDNWSIHYCLKVSKGKINGTANGALSCDYTGLFTVSGSYQGLNYTFTVTNPNPCEYQFYVVNGVADKKFKKSTTGTGTYDWNGDGIDGALNLTYVGRCKL